MFYSQITPSANTLHCRSGRQEALFTKIKGIKTSEKKYLKIIHLRLTLIISSLQFSKVSETPIFLRRPLDGWFGHVTALNMYLPAHWKKNESIRHLLIQRQRCKHQNHVLNLFNVNNKAEWSQELKADLELRQHPRWSAPSWMLQQS